MKKIIIFAQLLLLSTLHAGYRGQVGQDKYLNENYFHNKKNGVFIDIGAYDGITHSNTYFFEKDLGWCGICFEPKSSVFAQLTAVRDCLCINACVGETDGTLDFIEVSGAPEMLSGPAKSYDPRHFERLKREVARDGGSITIKKVPCVPLNKILDQYAISVVDFLSLDTEGSELEILRSIDFNKVYIYAIAVENNFYEPYIQEFLESKGFKFVEKLENQDDIFINTMPYPS